MSVCVNWSTARLFKGAAHCSMKQTVVWSSVQIFNVFLRLSLRHILVAQCNFFTGQQSMRSSWNDTYRGFWWSENSIGISSRKKVLLMTHLPISPMLNVAELMIHLEVQGCLDDSSEYDIVVTSKKLLFHKGVSTVDHLNPALNHS